ncbi:MAG: Archaeal flagella protein [Candidatus Syntrophoarchaeum sp. GoM_oil]|nr:MAG: Archaeal flagella protein [Candidatus Syntrophoarchaeum sp. GoM_oil]
MDIDKALNSFKGALNIKNIPNPFVNLNLKSKQNLLNVKAIKKNSLKNKFKKLAGDEGGKKKKNSEQTKKSSNPKKQKKETKEEKENFDDLFDSDNEEDEFDLDDIGEEDGGEDNEDDDLLDDMDPDMEGEDMEDDDEDFDDDDFGDDDDDFGDDDDDFGDDEPASKGGGGGGDDTTTVLLDRLDVLESKLSKADVTISMLKKENDEVADKVKKLDETTIQFLSLYEVISDQVNPFVGEAGMSSAVTERFDQIEARIGFLEDTAAVIKNIEARIETIQGQDGSGSLDTIKEMVDNLSHKINGMEDHVNEGGNSAEFELKFNNIFQRLTELGMEEDEIKKEFKSFKDVIDELKDLKTQTAISERVALENAVIPEVPQKQAKTEVERVENDPVKSLVLIRWVEFLLERVGRNNLLEALNYYVHIGWVAKELRNQAMEYATGMDYYKDKAEWRLAPEDHKKSLLFIEMIRGNEVDMITVNLVEQEVLKLKNLMGGDYGI